MNKIIAKYLPVEGEIKAGDKIIWPNGHVSTAFSFKKKKWKFPFIALNKKEKLTFMFDLATMPKGTSIQEYVGKQKLAKLFAVTQNNISPKDKVWDLQTNSYGTVVHISPKNIQVVLDGYDYSKETDHYHNMNPERVVKVLGEISKQAIWVKDGDEIKIKAIGESPDGTITYQVKCPTCTIYH